MAFKLNDPRPNVLKSKGLLNESPFKAGGNTMAYKAGDPVPAETVDKTKLARTMTGITRPVYDPESVKSNKEVRTKEFNETTEGKKLADRVNLLSGAMQGPTGKFKGKGENEGKYYYQDQEKPFGEQTVFFTPDDYKSATDTYALAKSDFARPLNDAMRAKHGDVATFTSGPTDQGGLVQDYGEVYERSGGDRYEARDGKNTSVKRPINNE